MRVRDVDDAIQRFAAAAEILLKLGRRDDALKVVERLLQHRADVRFARVAAEIYLARSDPTDAMAALSKLQICFKENPKDLETLGAPGAGVRQARPARQVHRGAEGGGPHRQGRGQAGSLQRPGRGAPHARAERRGRPAARGDACGRKGPRRRPPTGRPRGPRVRPTPRSPLRAETRSESHNRRRSSWTSTTPRSSSTRTRRPPRRRRSRCGNRAVPDEPQGTAEPERAAAPDRVAGRRVPPRQDYDRAVALLYEAVEELPGARELREKLCDVLIEAGDQAEAVRQMLAFARWLAGEGDVETRRAHARRGAPARAGAAGRHRRCSASSATPSRPTRPLGTPATPSKPATQGRGEPAAAEVPLSATYDPSAPLPSYDLEEVGADEALRGAGADHHHRAFAPSQLDDPFGDAPLPSFPMEDEAASFDAGSRDSSEIAVPQSLPSGDAAQRRPARWVADPVPPPYAGATGAAAPAEPRPARRGGARGGRVLRLARDVRRGAQPARGAARAAAEPPAPDRAPARARGARRRGAGDASGTRRCPGRVPRRARGQPGSTRSRIALRHRRLARRPRRARRRAAAAAKASERRARSASSRSSSSSRTAWPRRSRSRDAATHYDLGVAYKEMGLLDDAIASSTWPRATRGAVRLPLDDRDDLPRARQRRRRHRRLHTRACTPR